MCAIGAVALMALACSVPPEQPIVRDFFAASRLRDTTALSRFSTTIFEPREQGTVTSFEVRTVSPDERLGDVTAKEVTVLASVRSPDGRTLDKTLVVTLERSGQAGARPLYGGWIVTRVRDAPADPEIRPR
jgi:hypothetical protein